MQPQKSYYNLRKNSFKGIERNSLRMITTTPEQQKEVRLILLVFLFATLIIFRGILSGQIISNVTHIYNFQPWHFYGSPPDRGNYIMSDMVDSIGPVVSMGKRLQSGDIPLWDYTHQLGQPGAINLLHFWVYPLRFLSWILFGAPWGWTIEILLRFLLGGVFFTLFLRQLGVKLSIAIATSIGFTFGSNNIAAHQAGFSAVPLSAPIVLYCLERLFRSNSWKDVFWLTLSLCFFSSTSFLSVIFFFSWVITLYAVVRILQQQGNRVSILLKCFSSVITALLLMSFTLLPTVEFLKHGLNMSYRGNYGLAQLLPLSGLNAFFANVFGDPLHEARRWSFGTYINTGIFVGFLSACSFCVFAIMRILRKREPHVIALAAISIFLIFNIYKFPFEQLEQWTNSLPLFYGNRPTYQKTVLQMLIAILGALGIDALWKSRGGKEYMVSILWILSAIYVGIWALGKAGEFQITAGPTAITDWYLSMHTLFACALIVVALLGFFLRPPLSNAENFLTNPDDINPLATQSDPRFNRLGKSLGKEYIPGRSEVIFRSIPGVLLIFLFLGEAMLHSRNWISYTDQKYWFPEFDMTEFIRKNREDGRVVSLGRVAIPEMMSAYGFPVAAGRGSVPEAYKGALQLADPEIYSGHPTQTFFSPVNTDLNSPVWDLNAVKYFITGKRLPPVAENLSPEHFRIHSFHGGQLIERLRYQSRAMILEDGVLFENSEDLPNLLTRDSWNTRRRIALSDPEQLLKADSPEEDILEKKRAGRILSRKQKGNSIHLTIRTNRPAYVLLSEYYHRGWKATLNGSPVKIFPAYGFLQAIQLPQNGEHSLVVKFSPDSLKYGLILSGFGILFLILMRFPLKNK